LRWGLFRAGEKKAPETRRSYFAPSIQSVFDTWTSVGYSMVYPGYVIPHR
jgi:hypothetical protein